MRAKTLLVVLAALVICASVGLTEDKPWFDLKTCAFCKSFDMGDGEYLVDHMKAVYHIMPDGFLSIMTIEDDYKDEFEAASMEMQKVGEEMEKTGTMPQMCGHCTKYGELLARGAKSQEFNSDVAWAYMMTSDDPDLVKELHAFAEKNNAEMKKWDEHHSTKMEEGGK